MIDVPRETILKEKHMKKIKRSEIQQIVMMCPYCGTETNNDYGFCCGEPHAEEHIDTGDEYIPVNEVEIIEDVAE